MTSMATFALPDHFHPRKDFAFFKSANLVQKRKKDLYSRVVQKVPVVALRCEA